MTKQDNDTSGSKIWTIGHWTCPIPVFLETLDERSIDMLIDVRAHPGSRRNPQFGTDEMKKWLPENGIAYQLFPKLGGRRRKQDVPPEINAGWNNASFKNYADYTLTEKYHEGIAELKELTQKHRVAIMCGGTHAVALPPVIDFQYFSRARLPGRTPCCRAKAQEI